MEEAGAGTLRVEPTACRPFWDPVQGGFCLQLFCDLGKPSCPGQTFGVVISVVTLDLVARTIYNEWNS